MAIIYGKAISIGYGSSKPSGGGGGLYSIWLTIPAVATSVTFTAVKGDVSVASTYISNIGAAKITLPEMDYEGDWTVSGTVGGKTASQTVTVTSDKNDYFVDMRNDFIPLSGELKVGNLVTFDDKSWRVVHQEGTHWYLASENIVSQTPFGSNNAYIHSTIAGVASTYESEQLSDTAKEYCADVTVEGVTNKVFVPTHAQVNGGFSYYNSNANRICQLNSTNSYWWTSSPGIGVYSVQSDGTIVDAPGTSGGFRPHICIDTSLSGSATEETVLNGTYLFNTNPTAPAKYPFTETVPYKYGSSSGGTYQSIRFYQDTNTKNLCMYYHYSDTSATAVYNFTTKKWLNDTYKTIIFDNQTVSKEFYTWFIANTTLSSSATKTISAGRYYFNSILTTVSSNIDSNVDNNTFNFTLISNNAARTRITYSTGGILNHYDSNGNRYNTYSASAWNNNIYRDIKLASDQNVPEDFYNWFIANTSKS